VQPEARQAANVAHQLAIYACPGDAVIGVFDNQTRGMTLEQAKLSASAIQAAMTAEVMAQGPERVSKHCADPAKLSVVDMPLSSFTAPAASTFKSSAAARVTKLLNENGVYHLELTK
jgi:hypothetical protein